jgi:hypothetical protein
MKGLPLPAFKNSKVNTKSKNQDPLSDANQEPPKAS